MTIFTTPLRPRPTSEQLAETHVAVRSREYDRIGLPAGHQTGCKCGWTGELRDTSDAAEADWRNHWDTAKAGA